MSTSRTPTRPGPYAIIGAAKYKTPKAIKGIVQHNLRLGDEANAPGVDPARTCLNIIEGAADYEAVKAAIRTRIATASRKPRPDANRVVEFMVTTSPEFMAGKTLDEQLAVLRDAVEFTKEKVGAENVIMVSYQFDEMTPHAHILAVPMVTRERMTKKGPETVTTLDAQRVLGGPKEMEDMWTDFAKHMQAKGHALNRGVSKKERLAALEKVPKHKPVRQWWAEQVAEVDAMNKATVETLSEAHTQASQAAAARREALAVQQRLTMERSSFTANALAVQRAQQAREATLNEWHDGLERESLGLGLSTRKPDPSPVLVAPQANERPKDATPWTGSMPGPG